MNPPLNPSIDGKAIYFWLVARIDRVILVLAIAIRLLEFLRDRSMWMDEGSLYVNIVETPIFPLWSPLKSSQLAPAGFVAVERLVAQTLGSSSRALRILPMVSGIVAVLIFRQVSKKLLDSRSATIALALFALSYDPIYYSDEMKQYSSDLAISLACAWSALLVLERPNPRRRLALGGLALLAPWFSHPSAFTICGLGLGLLVFKAIDRRWDELIPIAAIGGVATFGFLGSYLASVQMLQNPNGMQHFWSITFLKFPPKNLDDAGRLGGQLLGVLTNPLDLISPSYPWLSVALATICIAACCWVVVRDRPRGLILLFLPIFFTAAASAAERYPFHGRLILFLVPAFHIAIVVGLGEVRSWLGWRWANLGKGLVGLVLLYPIGDAFYRVIENVPREFNPIGDLHDSPFEKPRP